jgi:acetolactate synthase-1/2/3 large subunit
MEASEISGAEFVYRTLTDAGVDLMVGLPGTQTLPLDRTIAEGDEIQYVMARSETAIPHIAWGHYESGGSVVATLTVPGPGDTNMMHGLKNAREDCVPILHFSADVDPRDRGKRPIHEIEPETFDTIVKENVAIKRPIELPEAMARALSVARTPPMGPVRIGIPSAVLNETKTYDTVSYLPDSATYDVNVRVAAAAEELADADRPLIYVGGGARRSPDGPTVVDALSTTLGAPVLSSYKGKGVFPEDDDRFLGVAGGHLPTPARQVLDQADVVLALGADFDGVATDHWELPFGETLVHVNLDTHDMNRAYDATIPLIADVGEAGRALRDRLQDRSLGRSWDGRAVATQARRAYESYLDKTGLTGDTTPLRTPALLETVRIVTPRDAVVTVDVGGFRLWAMQAFPTFARDRFIAAGSWAGMGVGLPAAIGAKLANPDAPVLSMIGDGGLFMCLSELHTAVEEGLDLVIIVSDNADYGIISKSPEIAEYTSSHQFRWSSPDFATIAEGFGCWSTRVDGVDGLQCAVATAFDRDEPVPKLISVDIEVTEPSAPAAGRAVPAMDLSLFEQISQPDD